MSLINKMLQDLDKRHAAADGGGKTPAQQLRPVAARRDWRRIMWEVGAGLIIGGGWAGWVLYQISPRSVVTNLALQSGGKKHRAAAVAPAPAAMPAAAPATAPTAAPPPVPPPAQDAAVETAPAVATMAAAAPAATQAASPSEERQAVNADTLKLATEIDTPFKEKRFAAKPRDERKRAVATAPAPRMDNKRMREQRATAPRAHAPKAPSEASIDKQAHASTPAERAENEFRKATGLLKQGRVAEAMDGYKSTLRQDAGHAAARQALVGLLLESRRIDEAQQFLQEGLSLYPDRSVYAMLLARIQVERGDLQGAHELLGKYAGQATNDADYHAFDAAVLQRLGRHQEAVTSYQAALRLAPRAGVWWMGMGISLQAGERRAEALEAYRRARSAGGLSPDLLRFVDQRMKQLQ